jgi:hypothetical protein
VSIALSLLGEVRWRRTRRVSRDRLREPGLSQPAGPDDGHHPRVTPKIRACPASIGSGVASIRSIVVFPAPFGPRTPKISPCRTSRSIPSTARTSPKALTRPVAATLAVVIAVLPFPCPLARCRKRAWLRRPYVAVSPSRARVTELLLLAAFLGILMIITSAFPAWLRVMAHVNPPYFLVQSSGVLAGGTLTGTAGWQAAAVLVPMAC